MSPGLLPVDLLPWGILIAALALYALAIALLLLAGRRTGARALAGFAPDCAILLRRLAGDPATPRRQRIMLALLVGYLLSPIDVIPDFLPLAGQLDDAILVALAVRMLLRTHGPDAVARAWPGPEASLRVVFQAAGLREYEAARSTLVP
jgi:uncharacterized membrane protein YkvA (DUF1232 family)